MSKRRRGQLNPHLRNIRRQRTPENKACLPAGSTSSLTSSTCKACWRQIYKTCDENQKKVTVACITCILLLQLSGEGTCNNLQTKLSILDPSQQQTQAAVQICQLYFQQCGCTFFFSPLLLFTQINSFNSHSLQGSQMEKQY